MMSEENDFSWQPDDTSAVLAAIGVAAGLIGLIVCVLVSLN